MSVAGGLGGGPTLRNSRPQVSSETMPERGQGRVVPKGEIERRGCLYPSDVNRAVSSVLIDAYELRIGFLGCLSVVWMCLFVYLFMYLFKVICYPYRIQQL